MFHAISANAVRCACAPAVARLTAIGIAYLAIGIGANTAIFNLVDAVMLRTLPFQRP